MRVAGVLKGATLSHTAHAWFISILVETANEPSRPVRVAPVARQGEGHDVLPARSRSHAAVGVDLGIKALATLSTGEVIEGPKALGMLLGRLKRFSRAHSRKEKGSATLRRSGAGLARLHWRISCVRDDAIHKLPTA